MSDTVAISSTNEVVELEEGFNKFEKSALVWVYMNNQYKISMYTDSFEYFEESDMISLSSNQTFIHNIENYEAYRDQKTDRINIKINLI